MRLLVIVAALCGSLAVPGAASAATVSFNGTKVFIVGDAGGSLMEVNSVGDDVIVTDTGEPLAADAGCSLDSGTVTCPGAAGTWVLAQMDDGNDVVTFNGIRAGNLQQGDGVYGGDGNDELTGSGLDDAIYGQDGDDDLFGRGGNDQLEGDDQPNDPLPVQSGSDEIDGGPGNDEMLGWRGADVITDTGGGFDTASYFFVTDPNGVEVTLNGQPDDGNIAEDAGGTDNVGAGIEHVKGSQFGDELQGGAGDDTLTGFDGDDTLIGNGGVDDYTGGLGNDRLEARDSTADLDLNCDDSANQGTADTAVVDTNDPTPRFCETINAPSTGGGGGGGGGQTTTTTQTPGPGLPVARSPFTVGVTSVESTVERSRMPNVVGRKLDPARAAVLRAVAGVDLDIVFQRGCRDDQDLEVVRQRPTANTTLESFNGSDLPMRLYVCFAERDFLRDCDLSDLKSDLKQLPKRQDAEPGLLILQKSTKCKIDYDIRLAKAAEEARVAAAAQAAKAAKDKRKGEIKAGLTCPTDPKEQNLRIALTEGYNAERSSAVLFGLHSSGGPNGWKLPSNALGQFRSFVDVQLFDRAMNLNVDATIYIDAEAVGIEQQSVTRSGTPQSVRTNGGYARINFSPTKAGKIRLCAVIATGDDEVLSAAVEIEVVGPLKVGDRWETIGGRTIELTKDGPDEAEPRAVARAANLNQVWDWLVGLFSGSSRTVNAVQRENTVNLGKVRKVSSAWAAGQVTLDGTLESNPQPPTPQQGSCFGGDGKGNVIRLQCPVMATTDQAALLGMSTIGARIVAAGAGNVIGKSQRLIGADGASLIGPDGASLIGPDGASLIGADGASLGTAPAQMVAAGAGNLIGADGASLIGADGAS